MKRTAQHPLGVLDVAYRGYMVRHTFAGLNGYTIEARGQGDQVVAIARELPSIEEAKRQIDALVGPRVSA